ncbi:MAG: hypothetical protein QOD83_4637 [Solirubrobacteraceae bacterium]|nr:hypothetical protein [Solirubrobacteraceae bacterium]
MGVVAPRSFACRGPRPRGPWARAAVALMVGTPLTADGTALATRMLTGRVSLGAAVRRSWRRSSPSPRACGEPLDPRRRAPARPPDLERAPRGVAQLAERRVREAEDRRASQAHRVPAPTRFAPCLLRSCDKRRAEPRGRRQRPHPVGMPINDSPPLSDRQARAVIIAAERLGFEREPDLHAPWYDHALHETPARPRRIFGRAIRTACVKHWSPRSPSLRTARLIASPSRDDSPARTRTS